MGRERRGEVWWKMLRGAEGPPQGVEMESEAT